MAKGILFSVPMVNALLREVRTPGTGKTQTRRLLSFDPGDGFEVSHYYSEPLGIPQVSFVHPSTACYSSGPVGFEYGDRLYVRETYFQRGHWAPVDGRQTKGGRQKWAFIPADDVILFDAPRSFRKGRYSADPATIAWHQRLGRFMPRAASRLTLIVEDVRVERLQAISEADAVAEGVEPGAHPDTGEASGWKDYSIIHGGPYKGERHPHAILPWKDATRSYQSLWETLHGLDSWAANPFVVAVSFSVVRGNIDQVPA